MPRPKKRKQDLMEAAITLFGDNGYHRTTIADIVQRAGVAQGTFYLYFESKTAIFIALLEQFFELITEAVNQVGINFDDIKTGDDFAVRIHRAVHSLLSVYRDNATLARICLREAPGLEPDFADKWESMLEPLVEIGVSILERAIERGLLPPQNTRIAAHCVLGMHERIAYRWLVHEENMDFDEIVDAMTRFELFGITGTGSFISPHK